MWPGKPKTVRLVAVLLALAPLPAAASGAQALWSELEKTEWIALGAEDPERVVYAFTDPNCPYCHLLWQASKPYYDEGLQVRHILVGYLKPSSPAKAAAIMEADNPSEALREHEESHASGGIEPADSPSDEAQETLAANRSLMGRLGLRGTPGLIFRNGNGGVRKVAGMPKVGQLPQIFRLPEQPQDHPALEPYK